MIVLDASVLIAHFDAADVHHERATQILLNAADETLGASLVTLAEVLVGPARLDRLDSAQTALRTLGVRTVAFEDDAPARLAHLRATTRLRLPDCCVLLAAHTTGAAVATSDARLAQAADELGLAVLS